MGAGALSQLLNTLFAEFPGMAAIQIKFSGEGGRKRGREEYMWCLYFTF